MIYENHAPLGVVFVLFSGGYLAIPRFGLTLITPIFFVNYIIMYLILLENDMKKIMTVSILVCVLYQCSTKSDANAYIYKCYNVSSGAALYTNVVCPIGYTMYYITSESNENSSVSTSQNSIATQRIIYSDDPKIKLAWMLTGNSVEERERLINGLKQKGLTIVER